MDEKTLIQEILQKLLDKSHRTKTSRIRVVNLSLYAKDIDPTELTRAFESLTFNTIAQGAHLHVRRANDALKDSALDPLAPYNLIRLDSFEMENPSMQAS